MAASAGAWYRVGKVNVVGGSQSIVGVGTNWQSDVIAIAIGDAFTLDAKTWYEVVAVNSDTSITLDRGFEGGTDTDKSYAILRNTSGTILTRIAGQVSVQFNQKQLFLDELRTWLNSDNETEELTDSHGLKQSLKTPSQMVRDHDNKLAELDAINPYPWAMRKVDFENDRAANSEKYAASGFVHFGKHWDNETPNKFIGEGLYTHHSIENSLLLGRGTGDTSVKGKSDTIYPVVCMAGVEIKLTYLGENSAGGRNRISFPPAENGLRTYDTSNGNVVVHSSSAIALASETDTNKIVTDRVDMWGLELFLREINDSDPFVYPQGLIQSQNPRISGLYTVIDNVRPASYFAWFAGDESSVGKGFNWQTATEAQRKIIASDPDNNIYFDDETGKFYQWCVRGRSFAGAGNGDWENVNSKKAALSWSSSSNENKRVEIQGSGDSAGWVGSGSGNHYYGELSPNHKKTGLFSSYGEGEAQNAVNGEAYFLVCGTVLRLNKGAYHPSFNPLGTRGFTNSSGQSSVTWAASNMRQKPSSKGDCFSYPTSGYPYTDGLVFSSGPDSSTGGVLGGGSKRPDDRYYDVIYASGAGGVVGDLRYLARGLVEKDFIEADQNIKQGVYRGIEYMPYTGFKVNLTQVSAGGSAAYIDNGDINYTKLDGTQSVFSTAPAYGGGLSALNLVLVRVSDGVIFKTTAWNNEFHSRLMQWDGSQYNDCTGTSDEYNTEYRGYLFDGSYPITEYPATSLAYSRANQGTLGHYFYGRPTRKVLSEIPISFEYLHTEVFGNPSDIIATSDFKDGWIGTWNPSLPDGTSTRHVLSRKVIDDTKDLSTYTNDHGETWGTSLTGHNLDQPKNYVTHYSIFAEGNVVAYQYPALSLIANEHDNVPMKGNPPSTAFFSSRHDLYIALSYSLTGRVNKDDSVGTVSYGSLSLERYTLLSNSFYEPRQSPTHAPINLSDPTNDSPAFKAISYNVEDSGQAYIQYAYCELSYASDWGDDSKIHIGDKQAVRLDDNGNAVIYGTARIVEPLGWIKNDK
ncbi:hypothetical protein PSH54_19225 [Pseudoalteromonas sp. Angola-30]|uniref:hypothetical protein n=1 Tax=Pseudoalteromonas sp. Angola-30 TaxID=3025341 RepID=UPI002358868C|nr:hypothetical protein [Pseudoalteromonas sp. Angola-30]MDC9527613.1 hypothetical protein [Pseudoalteromonas sp. Angola-30]